ncbi:MAG: GNAT family N-acetyltransferase [Chloroflexi bacterium]|nr:GNAT family N-acetyltransferase [Chloroflexota bacterium]
MIVTAPSQDQSKNGPRPINLNSDIPGILKLLEQVFGNSLDAAGQQMFSSTAHLAQSPAILWRLSPAAAKLSLGFVWEENGRIVGNVTVLPTGTSGRYLVVNVAVYPECRRQGIARLLMKQVDNLVRQRQGKQIVLQVVKQNSAAVELYNSLNYITIGSMTHWVTVASRLRRLDLNLGQAKPAIRELKKHEWRTAYDLDRHVLHNDLNWPELLKPDAYKTGFWLRALDFLNGRQQETWVTNGANSELTGLATLSSEWGRSHRAAVRVHPSWQGQLERPLLAKLVRRLHYLPRRNVQIEHPDDDELMNSLLQEANFQPRRTLTHMRLDLDG